MNSSDTLKCAKKASELVREISRLVNEITSAKNNNAHAMLTATRSLGEKLVRIQVYVDELANELKWRHEGLTRFKREIDRAVWLMMGMILCGVWLHFMR
jgi:ribosomal protein L17